MARKKRRAVGLAVELGPQQCQSTLLFGMNNVSVNTLLATIFSRAGKRFVHSVGALCATHYDTLKLNRDCTPKEIKEAFIKLSKEHHPDVNRKSNSNAEFQKIQEAYSVLSKPHLKHSYDIDIGFVRGAAGRRVHNVYYSAEPFVNNNPWADPSFYHNRKKDGTDAERPYYGIKGIKRQPNYVIAFVCLVVIGIVFSVQMVFIKYSVARKRDYIRQKSIEAEQVLKEVRERAEQNGKELQIEILKRKFEQNAKVTKS